MKTTFSTLQLTLLSSLLLLITVDIESFTLFPTLLRISRSTSLSQDGAVRGSPSQQGVRHEFAVMSSIHTRKIRVEMKSGGHGENFKFLPMHKGSNEDHYPRIIKVAGVFPNLLPENLLAPISTPAPAPGQWTYDFSDPEGPQLGTVAVPGSPVITACGDPVVMIANSDALGLKMMVEKVECLVVVDRADTKWTPSSFFVFRTPKNGLVIQWTEKVEKGYEILGKIVLVTVPWLPSMEKKKSGWLEEDD
jgi:hypothetical protein